MFTKPALLLRVEGAFALSKTPYPEGIRQTIDAMRTGAVAAQV